MYAQIPTPTQIPSAEKIKDPKTTFFFTPLITYCTPQMETLLISYDYIRQVIAYAQIKMHYLFLIHNLIRPRCYVRHVIIIYQMNLW